MQKYKFIIAYDGTDYQGWQHQPHKDTIADRLEHAFTSTFGASISILGASRTDAGVHALGQVAVGESEFFLEPTRLIDAWNDRLPTDILVRSIEVVDDFNPFANVVSKTYYYNLFLSRPLPLWSRFGWYYRFIDQVDRAMFADALALYVGEHDFASFAKIEEEDKSTVRRVDSITLTTYARFNMLQVAVTGPGFLRFQIRRMIGYALDVARREELSLDALAGVLAKPDPQQTLTKADACGLVLRRIVYSS